MKIENPFGKIRSAIASLGVGVHRSTAEVLFTAIATKVEIKGKADDFEGLDENTEIRSGQKFRSIYFTTKQ